MRVALGNDHAGYPLREAISAVLLDLGHEIVDLGVTIPEPVDYPDTGVAVARAVVGGEAELGIAVCGTGVGVSIAANKVRGGYAAACSDYFTAKASREHNGANILCLGARVVGPGLAAELVRVFVSTQPSTEERHARRRRKLSEIA